jgi:tetratricopeptide (TPR) repeat protein
VEAALAQYRKAVRYSPEYQPSRAALVRLTGSAVLDAPRTDAERQAAGLCRAASDAARRGAYPEAMRLIGEAERIAPGYVIVYQHRSNVAYLMGDVAAAIEALETALELEPGNALFEHNLRSLRDSAGTEGSATKRE